MIQDKVIKIRFENVHGFNKLEFFLLWGVGGGQKFFS